MNSRERILRAFKRLPGLPDRVPVQFDLCRQHTESFGKKLGIKPDYAISYYEDLTYRISANEIRTTMGSDVIVVGGTVPHGFKPGIVNDNITRNEFGMHMKPTSLYVEVVRCPLENASKVSDIENYSFPDPESQVGRASKQAALAFLGRLYLGEKRFADAAEVYKQIIDFNDNIIDPDYQSIFQEKNENSRENIFSLQLVQNLAPLYLPQHTYPAMSGGWMFVNPLGSLAEEYEFNDGTPFSYTDTRYNPKNLGENRDPRMGYTLMWNGSSFQGKRYICHPDSTRSLDQLTYSKQATRTGFALRKFFDENFNGDLQTGYGANIPVIRYAEVLLSYLEAKLEAGGPITQSLLDETINKIRSRPSVSMPPVTETKIEKLRPLLRHERRIELAMEGIRYWDIIRWEIGDQVLSGDFWGAPFPDSKRYATTSKKLDPNFRWYVTTKNFKQGVDDVWPIPQTEVNINPNLN